MSDPYAVLGVAPDISRQALRETWLGLVKTLHPDWRGGEAPHRRADAERRLAEVNAAYAAIIAAIDAPVDAAVSAGQEVPDGPEQSSGTFTVPAFRPMTFELLMLAAGDVGDVTDTDEPFSLVIHVEGPPTGFCRLELFPEAGGSVVVADSDQVDPRQVCQLLVAALVRLGVEAVTSR